MLGYLNINSVRNKLQNLFNIVNDNFDVLSIAETKIDESFTNAQFQIKSYKTPYRLDKSDTSGGILVYVKKGLPSNRLKVFNIPDDIQIVTIEIVLKNSKWLVISIYRPPNQKLEYFLRTLSEILDFYNYKNSVIIGDFNADPDSSLLCDFISEQCLHNHVNFKTCFKSAKGTCIDLILSNQKHCLKNTGTYSTGLSDYHHLIYTMLKSSYVRLPPKLINYRSYHKFVKQDFLDELKCVLKNFHSDYDMLETIFESVLDRHAPMKSKVIRGNEKPHMNKHIKKAIMTRTRLWNVYKLSKSSSDLQAYKTQRNLVTKLNRNAKKSYFNTACNSSRTDPKTFWRLCKPFFSDKGSIGNDLILKKDGVVIQDGVELAEAFNVHFNTITESLDLFKWNEGYYPSRHNKVSIAIDKFKDHPSVIKIHNVFGDKDKFHFEEITLDQVTDMVMALDCTKKTGGIISNKIMKLSSEIICPIIKNLINTCIRSCKFPNKLKQAVVTPIPKKGDSHNPGDYRPISILPAISKLYEKTMAEQLSKFFEKKFSILLCGFRKRHSTQDALARLLNSWQSSLDKKNIVGTVLMDLSKAYDCLPHDLLIAKLAAYGIDFPSLNLLYDYLSNRLQRVRVQSFFSDWLEIIMGIPQGSILGPILFNIFLNDLFWFIEKAGICNFADDNTLFASATNYGETASILQEETRNVLNWFKINSLAANPAKFQVMFLGVANMDEINFSVGDIILVATNSVKLLGVEIDNKLTFKTHVQKMCKTVSQKSKALLRIRSYLSLESAKRLCDVFILQTFNYCPLIWMFGCKTSNTLINKVHKKVLSVVYRNFNTSLEELLCQDKSVKIHVRNLRTLLYVIYKSLNKENATLMWEMFKRKTNRYKLRTSNTLELPPSNNTRFATKSFLFRGSILWNSIPDVMKSVESSIEFKQKLKSWTGENCSCHICTSC